jgi:hypothetical protein
MRGNGKLFSGPEKESVSTRRFYAQNKKNTETRGNVEHYKAISSIV